MKELIFFRFCGIKRLSWFNVFFLGLCSTGFFILWTLIDTCQVWHESTRHCMLYYDDYSVVNKYHDSIIRSTDVSPVQNITQKDSHLEYFQSRRKYIETTCTNIYETLRGDVRENASGRFIKKKSSPYLYHTKLKNQWIYYSNENYVKLMNANPKREKIYKPALITWCPIFKAGSTTWMSVFTKLVNALTPLTEAQVKKGKFTLMKLAKDFRLLAPPNRWIKIPENRRYKMVVVRHPFERLLSAYRDKIERVRGREYYHRKYARKIISIFRPNVSSSLKNPPKKISREEILSQFVHGLLWSKKLKDTYQNQNYDLVPTFEEFVMYVLSVDPRIHDQHWRPMYLDCHPCRTKFDLILKVETMNADRDVVFDILSLNEDHPKYNEMWDVLSRWDNKAKPSLKFEKEKLKLKENVRKDQTENSTQSSAKIITDDVNLFYFAQLSKDLVQKLYKVYQPDFTLFDYSAEKYMKIFE